MNAIDDCIYHKFNKNKDIFLVLYIYDILLINNDISVLYEIKRFLSKKFEIKDLNNASFMLRK